MRTVTRSARVSSIAAPLLIVTTSLEEAPAAEQRFGLVPEIVVLGVFARPGLPEPAIDLRDRAEAGTAAGGTARVPTAKLSLEREPGDREATRETARMIGQAITRTGAATVAIGLGLRGGQHLDACDAALIARRTTRNRVAWMVYVDSESEADAGRIARRRMQLLLRGIRLEPVAVAEAPMGTTARYWEIRPPRDY